MDQLWEKIMKAGAALGGFVAGLLGGWSYLLTILLFANAIDYGTGLLCAWRGKSSKTENGKLSSKVGFDGLARKGIIWAVVLLATLLDKAIGNAVMAFQSAAACYYIANEGLSILENAALMGAPLPPFIKNALEALAKQAGETNEQTTMKPIVDVIENMTERNVTYPQVIYIQPAAKETSDASEDKEEAKSEDEDNQETDENEEDPP